MNDTATSTLPVIETRGLDPRDSEGDLTASDVQRPRSETPLSNQNERPIILLSNREPYEHVAIPEDGTVVVRHPYGGLVTALDPALKATHGVWVAWGSGSGDRAASDAHGRVDVPPAPEDPMYTLRRVWLDDADVEGYYLGFANSVLWPLCHLLIHHLRFRDEDWARYQAVNQRFADAALEEAMRLRKDTGREAIAWIQDYHLALVADSLRAARPELFIHQFLHIPFPPPEIFRLLPYGVCQSLLRGLLGNDLLAFHTERYAVNFVDCAAQLLPGAVGDRAALTVRYADRTTALGVYPISIDVDRFEALAAAPEAAARAAELRQRYAWGDRQLGVSVDRIDYTKGILERLSALEVLWSSAPELRDRFTMLIVTAPSRTELRPYRVLEQEIDARVAALNARFGTPTWTPIVVMSEAIPATELAAIYRAADLCLVSSLQDGMNLVAKEFVACQLDERGVLVLSRFTGAAEEIEGVVLINPFNVDGMAAAIRSALAMPVAERQRRMGAMRRRLRQATVFDWLNGVTSRVASMAGVPPADIPADG
jgi:trehalose 6-phosphate synthase